MNCVVNLVHYSNSLANHHLHDIRTVPARRAYPASEPLSEYQKLSCRVPSVLSLLANRHLETDLSELVHYKVH